MNTEISRNNHSNKSSNLFSKLHVAALYEVLDFAGVFCAQALCAAANHDINEYGAFHVRYKSIFAQIKGAPPPNPRARNANAVTRVIDSLTFKEYLKFFNLCPNQYRDSMVPRIYLTEWHLNTSEILSIRAHNRRDLLNKHYKLTNWHIKLYCDLYDVVDASIKHWGSYDRLDAVIKRGEARKLVMEEARQRSLASRASQFEQNLINIARDHGLTADDLKNYNRHYYDTARREFYYFHLDFYRRAARIITLHRELEQNHNINKFDYPLTSFKLYKAWIDDHLKYSHDRCAEFAQNLAKNLRRFNRMF